MTKEGIFLIIACVKILWYIKMILEFFQVCFQMNSSEYKIPVLYKLAMSVIFGLV